jgi:hypothetical protein
MRPLLLIILVLAIARPAVAQCDGTLKLGTVVVAEREPVTAAADFSVDQISGLAKRSGTQSDTAPLGFYTAQVVDELSVSLDHAESGECLPRLKVELHLRLAQRRIEIGREVMKQPCQYEAVMEHYRKKAAADEAAFIAYVDAVATALRVTPFSFTAKQATAGLDDAAKAEVEHWVKAVVDQGGRQFHEARVAAQREVDSPDELGRVKQACGRDA